MNYEKNYCFFVFFAYFINVGLAQNIHEIELIYNDKERADYEIKQNLKYHKERAYFGSSKIPALEIDSSSKPNFSDTEIISLMRKRIQELIAGAAYRKEFYNNKHHRSTAQEYYEYLVDYQVYWERYVYCYCKYIYIKEMQKIVSKKNILSK